MFTTALAMILLATIGLHGALAAEPAARRRCENLPSNAIRIGFTSGSPVASSVVTNIVNSTWRTDGLKLAWLELSPSVTLDQVDLLVIVEDKALADAPPSAMGAVRFVAGQPQKIVRISMSAVAGWLRLRMIEANFWPRAAPVGFGGARGNEMRMRAFGYVLAHEIGHFLLASKQHSVEGIMRAGYADVRELDAEAAPMTLDNQSRERLRLRMAGLASCG